MVNRKLSDNSKKSEESNLGNNDELFEKLSKIKDRNKILEILKELAAKDFLERYISSKLEISLFKYMDFSEAAKKLPFPEFKKIVKSHINNSVLIHDKKYRFIILKGKDYTLTEAQGAVIKVLYESYKKNIKFLTNEEIMEKIGRSYSNIKNIFRSSPDAWKEVILKTRKGLYGLNLD